MNEASYHQQHGRVAASAGLYGGDVFAKVGDAQALMMQAFPEPPAGQLDHHVEIGEGSFNVESEMVISNLDQYQLGDLMKEYTQSLHVHNASSSTTTPEGFWMQSLRLRRCRVERCRNLDTLFQHASDIGSNLEHIWASDLLTARCIWENGPLKFFRSLRHLHLRSCPSLQYALPVSEGSMPSLETLHVIHCGNLRHIFVLGADYQGNAMFPVLTSIHLHDLPALEQISEFKMIGPWLETIKIRGCWSLRRLPQVRKSSRPPAVEVEKDVWDALEWDGVDAGHLPGARAFALLQEAHAQGHRALVIC